jgi:hypothetical protein
MKKYISLFLSIALLAVLAGCAGDELSKADYDFTPDPAALPTAVTVTAGAGIFDATLTGSVTLGSDTVVLQKGFVVSTTADFATERIVPANAQTFRATVNNLESGSTYYAKAYVATHNGTAYSNATQFSTKVVTTILDVQSATSSLSDWETFYEACTFIDKDGDESEWSLTYYDEEETQVALISYSYSWYDNSPLEPENYLLLPAVTLNTGGIFIVTMEAADPDYPEEKVKLIISDAPITGANCADAEVLAEHTLEDGEPYTFNADIPESYNNGNVYLGIAHYDCTDQYAVIVTGIKVVHVE